MMSTLTEIKRMISIILHLVRGTYGIAKLLSIMVGWAMMALTLAYVLALINHFGVTSTFNMPIIICDGKQKLSNQYNI